MSKVTIHKNPNYAGEIELPILRDSATDLEEIDFSPLGLLAYRLFSDGFEEYFEKMSLDTIGGSHYKRNINDFREINDLHRDENLYVIVPESFKESDTYSVLNNSLINGYHVLLVAYPSSLHIKYKLLFETDDNKFVNPTLEIHPTRSSYQYPGNLFEVENINALNLLISKYSNYKSDNLFEISFKFFIASFNMHYFASQYLNLIMALECFIYGSNELSYRLRRGISIICGIDESSCWNICDNLKTIYSVRSKYVHGEDDFPKVIHVHLPYLIKLVSVFLKELITHQLVNKEKLNQNITPIGFGDYEKLSESYDKIIIDKSIEEEIYTYKLPKK